MALITSKLLERVLFRWNWKFLQRIPKESLYIKWRMVLILASLARLFRASPLKILAEDVRLSNSYANEVPNSNLKSIFTLWSICLNGLLASKSVNVRKFTDWYIIDLKIVTPPSLFNL